ncbi:EAL domain-containing protein [Colwelliaceae bacterium 6471]
MNSYLTNKNLNIVSIILAVLLFVTVKYYIDVQFENSKEKDETKLAIISEQIASRLAIFNASRTRSLNLLSQNWPDAHPNMQQWFTHNSLDILYILPGIESIWRINANNDTAWRVPLDIHKGDELSQLSLANYVDDRIYVTPIFTLPSAQKAIAIVKPQFSQGHLVGWLVCVIDFESAFYFMLGDYEQSGLFISLYDNEQLLIQDGEKGDGVTFSRKLNFGDKRFILTLGAQAAIFDRNMYLIFSALFIAIFVLVLRLLVLKSINASKHQQRFVAATKNSLDGVLIFCQKDGNYQLNDANAVAVNMLSLALNRREQLDYAEFIQRMKLSHYDELFNAPKRVAQGDVFDQSYQLDPQQGDIAYIKMQIVSAGDDIAVTIRNITPRKLAEIKLKKREEKYRRLVEGLSGHFLYSLNTLGEFVYVSVSVKDILGYSPRDFLENVEHYLLDPASSNAELCTSDLSTWTLNRLRPLMMKAIARGELSSTYTLTFKDGNQQERLIEFTDAPVFEDGVLVAIEGVAKDITKEKKLADEVFYQANHDALTGLHNRYAFDRLLNEIISAVSNDGQKATLCYVDLDQFKIVNDTSGHMAGDELLNQLGAMITATISEQNIVARLGGDEFGVIFVGCDTDAAKQKAQTLLKNIYDFRFVWDDKLFRVSASIGIAPIKPGITHAEVMKAADVACYVAKDSGRNRVNVYSDDDEDLNYHKSRIDWANKIRDALEQHKFRLFCQTIKSLDTNKEHELCYEILIRMVDEQGQLISPALFIPAAERFDLMHEIDRWVFLQAITLLSQAPELLDNTDKCSINLSGASIVDEVFAEQIKITLAKYKIPPEKICFEITETEAVTKLNDAGDFIASLREFGCKFALDDFGAGMCSFSYLKNLPVDYIKIDGSFVKNMCNEPTDKAIVQSIDDIAKSLGKYTIAEFVGDQATENALREIGVNFVQGYFIEQPMPFEEYVNQSRFCQLAS